MRIAFWKSGWMGLEFTNEETAKLDWATIPITVAVVWPKSNKARELLGPTFIIGPKKAGIDKQPAAKILAKKKLSKRAPQYTRYATLDFSRDIATKELGDFTFTEASEVKYIEKRNEYHVRLPWAQRKPAIVRGRFKQANGNGAAHTATATTDNLLAPRVKTLLERINYIIERNPGRVHLRIESDGTLRAAVANIEQI